MSKLRVRADLILSAIVYVLGTASLFLVDLLLAKTLESNPEQLADWAFMRSVVFFASGLALFGCEQSVVRQPMRAKVLLPPLTLQVSVLCLPLFLTPWFVSTSYSSLSMFVASASLAVIMGVCGHLRSHMLITLSQVSANGWKLVFGLVVAAMWWFAIDWGQLAVALASCLLLCAIGSLAIGWMTDNERDIAQDTDRRGKHDPAEVTYRSLLPIGMRFWLFALMANAVTYLDQILLSFDGQKLDSSLFFTYRAIFLPLALLAIGYIGVVVAPYIRNNPMRFRKHIRLWLIGFVATGVLLGILSLSIGLALGYMMGKFADGVDWPLITAFVIMGLLRYSYVLPSAMMSVYATRRELDWMLFASSVGVISMIFVYYFMQKLGYRPIWSVIIGSYCNLISRMVYGLWLSAKIYLANRPVGSLA